MKEDTFLEKINKWAKEMLENNTLEDIKSTELEEKYMKTEILKLPCTDIQVLLNGNPIPFEYKKSSYNTFYLEDGEKITILGAINIIINPKMYQIDDEIYIMATSGNLQNDGRGEYTVSCVAELEDYTYGLGGPDTEFIEWRSGSIPGHIPVASMFGYCQRVLDYEYVGMLDKGLKYKIVKSTTEEKCGNGNLIITVVWEDNAKDYAYDIVSCLIF